MTRRSLLGRLTAMSLPLLTAETLIEKGAMAQDKPGTSPDNFPLVQNPRATPSLLLNQVGYRPGDSKQAIITSHGPLTADTFAVVEDAVARRVRLEGALFRPSPPLVPANLPNTPASAATSPGDAPVYYVADFAALTQPGRYRLRLANGRLSAPFSIGENVYRELMEIVLPYFDCQKCGSWSKAHAPCHREDGVIVGGPRDGQPIDASGGWHDAGDYLKFVETTSFVTALMATTVDRFLTPHRHDHEGAALREAVLASLRVGLDWLLKMHPAPDEFYYQVGNEADHDKWRLPETDSPAGNKDGKPRPVYWGVGANLAGRVAISFAIASRLYHSSDRAFAERCRSVAESAYLLGLKNQKVLTTLPADFYPEQSWRDDMEWAAAELYRTTRQEGYRQQALDFSREVGASGDLPGVYSAHTLAHFSLHEFAPPADKERLLGYLRADAELVRKRAGNNLYGFGAPLVWGTAEAVAGAGILCHLYAKLSGDAAYAALAHRQRDFLLGCNPWGVSFVIGAGSHYPLNPHHQIANLRGLELTGALVGGPASKKECDKENIPHNDMTTAAEMVGPPLATDDPAQAAVYYDTVQNYVTNEPANDYTVKFLLLTALDAFAH